jgi:phosphotriesterase-related protein
MSAINTIAGKVDSGALGVTLPHEHLISRKELVWVQFPHLYDDEADLAIVLAQINRAMELGVRTIFEPTVMGIGRDVNFMRRVADASGLNIVAATGAYTFNELPATFQGRDVDYLADCFVRDIEIGIGNSDMRAAFLKTATDKPGITPGVEKSLRATARAHLRTGVPIMTHTSVSNQSGLMQLDIFEDEGVNLGQVMIGHCGDTDDMDYLEKIIERGARIGLDRYGMDDYLPTARRNATVIRLCELGYTERMLLSQDHVCVYDSYFPTDEVRMLRKDVGYTFIIERVLPDLRAAGVTDSQIHTMMVTNPANWISGA